MTASSILHSVLVQGRLAYATRCAAAARNHELGLQIMTPSLLAARLAGGLLRPASRESIEIGIRSALSQPGLLEDITPISGLPGAIRAVLSTLRNVWRACFDLRAGPYAAQPRVQDLARIENAVRLHLQPSERLLPDLCHRAPHQAVAGVTCWPVQAIKVWICATIRLGGTTAICLSLVA
jgi:hypothetical protein